MSKPMQVFIPGRMPGLNEFIGAINRNRFLGNKMKQENTDSSAWCFRGMRTVTRPVMIRFTWNEINNRRDPDNIIFAKKFILDGMVKAGVLPDDTQKWVLGFRDYIVVDKANPGILVTVVEKEDQYEKNR